MTSIAPKINDKLKSALSYAERGWAVLPVLPNEKRPATPHGVHDATTDPDRIRDWWTQNPEFNVGIAAGQASKIIVFDIDPRNGGDKTWSDWVAQHGEPDGLRASTAGGGQHYIAHYTAAMTKGKVGPGVDVLADGRYFLAEPSTIEGRAYKWDNSKSPWLPTPNWVESLSTCANQPKESQPVESTIVNGQRSNALTALGGSLRHIGLGEPEIFAALSEANSRRCSEPLPESEVRAIAKSVSRYEADRDVVTASAIGDQAAEALLAPKRGWLVAADEFCSQPAPIKWLVKKWLPERSLCMVHGPSGSGKTFAVLDWVLRVASGISDWQGHTVRPGNVVILAGEGHAGLRGRVAAWKQTHGIDRLNCHISQAGISLDTVLGREEALDAIRALNEPPAIVVVDTLHSHMTGDENSSKDAGAMLAGCRQIMTEFGCSVLLVHHTGHSEAAQHRARGSSAWKAALDIEVSVETVRDCRVVTQRKNKDAELCEPRAFEIQSVEIEGWVDDDGEPYRSAVAVPSEVPEKTPKPSKVQEFTKLIESAWYATGASVSDQRPYISRSALAEYLTTQKGISERSAAQYLKESAKNKLIGCLTDNRIVGRHEHGWAIIEPSLASSLMLNRQAG